MKVEKVSVTTLTLTDEEVGWLAALADFPDWECVSNEKVTAFLENLSDLSPESGAVQYFNNVKTTV